jgi:hypothetical protein
MKMLRHISALGNSSVREVEDRFYSIRQWNWAFLVPCWMKVDNKLKHFLNNKYYSCSFYSYKTNYEYSKENVPMPLGFLIWIHGMTNNVSRYDSP